MKSINVEVVLKILRKIVTHFTSIFLKNLEFFDVESGNRKAPPEQNRIRNVLPKLNFTYESESLLYL